MDTVKAIFVTDYRATALELIKNWQDTGYQRFFVNKETACACYSFSLQVRDMAPGAHHRAQAIPSAKEPLPDELVNAVIDALVTDKLKRVTPKRCLITLRS